MEFSDLENAVQNEHMRIKWDGQKYVTTTAISHDDIVIFSKRSAKYDAKNIYNNRGNIIPELNEMIISLLNLPCVYKMH